MRVRSISTACLSTARGSTLGAYTYKYPKAGTPNSKVSVHIYNVTDRAKKPIDFKSAPYYIPRIEFIGRDGNLAVFSLNRQQNHLTLYYVNNKTLLPKVIFEERNKAYVDSRNLPKCKFVPSGFAYLGEQDGYRHIYLYSDKGALIRKITTAAMTTPTSTAWTLRAMPTIRLPMSRPCVARSTR